MEILSTLGLEGKVFIAQLINFLVVVFILKIILYKPLRKMLNERKNRIEKGLQDAADAKIALENAGEERKKILASAKSGADELTALTKASLEEIKIKLTQEAKNRSEQILEDAKQKAAMEFENMNRQIGKISVDISGKVMMHVFSSLFTDEEKNKILARALDKIEKVGYEKKSN
ncbi:MAG: ATP synthase F0 subunit B [Endomicrobium sp.]|jgi:F-type H+-transporting ATPase subunit b|nr:ATP synthase F0 subunit B [Endomicrobium sp.]